jgi:predicted DNA-binding transcriptional regulator YafY
MPKNKKAITRFLVIDRCIRSSKKYSFQMILEEVNKQLEEEGMEGIGRTQLYKDFNDLEFSTYKAPLERIKEGRTVYFTYSDPDFSIRNQVMEEEDARQIKEALVVLSRFKGIPQFEWVHELIPRLEQSFHLTSEEREIISFETNEYLKGLELLGPLFQWISEKAILEIVYRPFQAEENLILLFEPHYLKQYNNRWYLLGFNQDHPEDIHNLPLDRMVSVSAKGGKYQEIYPELFEEFFDDIIGVTRLKGVECEKIKLKFPPSQAPYIKTKPLHGSQKVLQEDEEGLIIQLELIPNYELETLLLGFGEKVMILSPDTLRDKIKHRLGEALKGYGG